MPFGRDAVGAGREPVTPEQFMAAGAVKRRELDAFDRLPVDREGYFGHVRLVGAAQGARQYRSDAVEFDYAGFGERLVDCAAFGRIMPFERLFETDGYGLLACYGNIGFTYGTAVAADYFQCLVEAHLVGAVERDVGIGELHIFHFAQVAHPFFGDFAVPEHCAQDTAGRCRVAIRVLSATGGDVERLREIALAVKQADEDVGAVGHGVDVERHEYPVGAADIRTPFLFAFEPRAFPVAGILLVPGDDVFHAPVIAALFGDGFQGFLDDEPDVVRDERKRIHRCHVNSAVPAVAVVHDVSRAVAELRGRVGHARGHEPREIGFDLEVEVVGMGVVEPVPRLGRADAVEDVVACGLVGMPQDVAGIGEGCGERIHRGVDAQAVEDLDER